MKPYITWQEYFRSKEYLDKITAYRKKFMPISILALLALTLTGCEPIERHSETCKILSIDKQVETSGSGDTFSTDIYWLVVTDNGSYHIRTDGLWACPDAVGAIQKDSVYSLTVDGWFSSSFLGVYPYIVGVSPCMEKYDEKKGESR